MAGNRKKIAVVGLGYVGLPLALLCEKKGYEVFGVVKTKKSAESLNRKHTSIVDKDIVKSLKRSKIHVDFQFSKIKESSIIVICVPTPVTKNFSPDFRPLINAAKKIGKNLQKKQLVILESTVNPGVSEEIVIPILEKESGLICGKDFYYAYCPERINPGDTKWTVEIIPRVVGAAEKKSLSLAFTFYKSILTASVMKMDSLKEAEAVKIVENSFRDINIAFVNELAKSFSLLGIDIEHVLNGASTKPFSFLRHNPGIGVGGHCIPVDPYYLIKSMKKKGFSHKLLSTARLINNSMPSYAIQLLEEKLLKSGKTINDVKVGILGVSYKPNINDTRESPFFNLFNSLKKKKTDIAIYDPYVPELSTHKSLSDFLKTSDVIILTTAHHEFLSLTEKKLAENNVKIIIDGRNCLNKENFKAGKVLYKGIGR